MFKIEDGSVVQEKSIQGLKKIVKVQDGSLAALVGESIFTISKDTFNKKQNQMIEEISEVFSTQKLNSSRKFQGTKNIFSLHNLNTSATTNEKVVNSESKNFVLLVRSASGFFADIVDTKTMSVVNSFDSPHAFFEINSVEVVSGTDLLITAGDDNKINIIKAFEHKFGYPSLVQSFSFNHPVLRAIHIPGTTTYAATFYQTYQDSPKNLVIKHFCGFKHCEECSDFTTCSACRSGLHWDDENKKCSVSAF